MLFYHVDNIEGCFAVQYLTKQGFRPVHADCGLADRIAAVKKHVIEIYQGFVECGIVFSIERRTDMLDCGLHALPGGCVNGRASASGKHQSGEKKGAQQHVQAGCRRSGIVCCTGKHAHAMAAWDLFPIASLQCGVYHAGGVPVRY